jgi:phospholipid/cholesterol/gamma-HCH transport system permease protein
MTRRSDPPRAVWTVDQGRAVLALGGRWHREGPAPEVEGTPSDGSPLAYETSDLKEYDSTLPAFLLALIRPPEALAELAEDPTEEGTDGRAAAQPSLDGLPDNLRGLMELALGVPERSDARPQAGQGSSVGRLRDASHRVGSGILSVLEFVGLSLLSLGRFFTGRARFRRADLWLVMQECGAQALPIVSLISFLIGVILAFVGGYQLAGFGAEIFVADLVGIAMVREMGVVMTGIIMSGRTGAAFAAHIGSMKANEEIDALRTFGLDPFDFLVLPRLLALVIMMPLLTVYANLVGILGGMLVGTATGLPAVLYWQQTVAAIDLTTASLGVFKSFFFGGAIAICGCLYGMAASSSSAGVGQATTRAVVASITAVIVLDSAFAALFTVLGI